MASLESTSSPPALSFRMMGRNGFFRSISTKEPSSFSELSFAPPRFSTSSIPQPFHTSPPPSPPPCSSSSDPAKLEKSKSSYRCISSILKKDGQILSIAVSNDLVYTGSETNCIRIWKLPEFTECGQLKTKANMVSALAVSRDRVFAAYADFKIRVWRRSFDAVPVHVRIATVPTVGGFLRSYIAGKDRKLMKHLGSISSLSINLSNDLLYSASLDKTVKVWRISDLKCIETIRAHSESVNAIVISNEGVIYTASDDATVRVWRPNSCLKDQLHSLTLTLPAEYSPVKALALTTDGEVLYGGCTDGYIHYWIKAFLSGQLQYGGALQGHTHAVMCLAVTANYIVTGSADWTSRVWIREQDGQHTSLAVLQGHRGPIRCITAFTDHVSASWGNEDGCTVCTGSLDGVLKVWRVVRASNASHNSMPCGHEYLEL